jgi:hypothetical protein
MLPLRFPPLTGCAGAHASACLPSLPLNLGGIPHRATRRPPAPEVSSREALAVMLQEIPNRENQYRCQIEPRRHSAPMLPLLVFNCGCEVFVAGRRGFRRVEKRRLELQRSQGGQAVPSKRPRFPSVAEQGRDVSWHLPSTSHDSRIMSHSLIGTPKRVKTHLSQRKQSLGCTSNRYRSRSRHLRQFFVPPLVSGGSQRPLSRFAATLKRLACSCYTVCTVQFSFKLGRRPRRGRSLTLRPPAEIVAKGNST